ncbi:MAG: GNAT family N-acetyltransferase [Myxococcaceae bacterium]
MPLVVRRVKVQDLSLIESIEQDHARSFPTRKRWMETFRSLLERSLTEEPEGLLIADYDGRPVGAAIARVRGAHPVTGEEHGRLEALTVAPAWRQHGVRERLIKEAEAYLKSRGCRSMVTTLPADAGADGELFKQSGFKVASWELSRTL